MSRGNRISLMESIKRRDPQLAGITCKITQQESQKIDFIVKVLDYGLKHKKFSIMSLQKNLKISRNSLDRTIHMLLKKKFIKLTSTEIKNEKFYSIISKKNVRSYRNDLLNWKRLKIYLKAFPKSTLHSIDNYQRGIKRINRIIRRNTKRSKFSSRNPDYLESIPICFKSKSEQSKHTEIPYPKTVFLKTLPSSFVIKIREKYRNFRLCDVCLKQGRLVDVYNTSDDEAVCIEQGHQFNSRIMH